jgi:hypothetical protein
MHLVFQYGRNFEATQLGGSIAITVEIGDKPSRTFGSVLQKQSGSPLSARWRLVASFPLSSAQACPSRAHQKKKTKESETPILYSCSAAAMKAGVGRNSGSSTSAPSSSASTLLSSSLSLRSRSFHPDASVCASSAAGGGASLPTSVVARKSTPPYCIFHRPIGPEPSSAFPPPRFLSDLRPQGLLLVSPPGAYLEEVARLCSARAPPALSGGAACRPVQVLPGEAVTYFQLVEPRGVPLGATATVLSGFCLAGILYFFLVVRLAAHWRASAHFFSEISCLRCARDHGSSIPRSSAASLAHSSAFSLPGTPLCAGPKKVQSHQGNYKGKTKEITMELCPQLLLLFRERHEGGRWVVPHPAPSSSASTLLSSLSLRSRSSHSDASLCASASAGGGTRLPTSVVERKSSAGWLHLLSAKSSRILNRSFPLTSAHSIFCCGFQRGQFLKTCSRVSASGTGTTGTWH